MMRSKRDQLLYLLLAAMLVSGCSDNGVVSTMSIAARDIPPIAGSCIPPMIGLMYTTDAGVAAIYDDAAGKADAVPKASWRRLRCR